MKPRFPVARLCIPLAVFLAVTTVTASRAEDPPDFLIEWGGFGPEVPNNTFGSGRIDAWAAYQLAIGSTTSVPGSTTPGLQLLPATPNPVRGGTLIQYEIPETSPVTLRIYDVAGRLVRELVNRDSHEAGMHAVAWNGRGGSGDSVASGIYLYRLTGAGASRVQKLVVVR